MVHSSQLGQELAADAERKAAPSPGAVLAVLSAAAFMASMDVFIVNVAFTDIGRDFRGESVSDLSWVLNSYAIVYAALLVPLGRLSDRYGRKAGFLIGLAAFTLASAACALSPGLWWLVACRVLQAAGAAALTPASLGLLLNATPAERRSRAVRIWATSGSLAAAAGPVIGGLLVQISWQWVFIVNVPIGVLAFIAAARVVPDSREVGTPKLPDLIAAAVLAVAIAALALALVEGPDWGWGSPRSLIAYLVSAAAGAVFTYRTATHPVPVVEPSLLKVRAFAWSNITALLFSVAFAGSLLATILWMQDVWGFSALKAGLCVAPSPLMVPVFAVLSQRYAPRVPVGLVAAAGCVLAGIGSLVMAASVGAAPQYASEILPGWMLAGAGVGLALPTILSAATVDLPPDRSATGSAVVNMSRQIGFVLGVSVLVAVLGTPHGFGAVHQHFQHAWWAIGVCAITAAVAAIGMTPRRTKEPA